MLLIKTHNGYRQWYIGEPLPDMGCVVDFQADGDELNLFIDAMIAAGPFTASKHTKYVKRIGYTKLDGFRIEEKKQ